MKRRGYEQRIIEIENGSFTPLIFCSNNFLSKTRFDASNKKKSTLLSCDEMDAMSAQFQPTPIINHVYQRIKTEDQEYDDSLIPQILC